mmetsp:Transcript_38462/g.108775  ORF Transcript_38462/g.108775 Transcript_38462/m.108775 type:complete len:271 (+) Transcript_38462:69-881(+)
MAPAEPGAASVVVPTYKEVGNIEELCKRLFAALKESGLEGVELIIVDDNSRDGTVELCDKLSREYPLLRLITRTTERGLSTAVLRGFDEAKGRALICMDADLQHPPERVPRMIEVLGSPGAEFALGTRYGGEGKVDVDKDWPLHRQVISWGARLLARPLTPMSDPMSGFFGMTRESYERARPRTSALGYKIALELYVKSGVASAGLREVSFVFGLRSVGESKLTGKVIVHYIRHLVRLYWYSYGPLALLLLVVAVVCLFSTFFAASRSLA